MGKEENLVDYRVTEIGRQNWEVCSRMLVHDLLDIGKTNKQVQDLLDYYHINFTSNGGYTMALPRKEIFKKLKGVSMPCMKGKGKKKGRKGY